MIIHIVEENQTIFSIANTYGVSVKRLIYDNQLYTPNELAVGQAILVLIPELVHQVKEGESISSIAKMYDVTEKTILRNNPFLVDRGYLVNGEYIIIRYQDDRIGNIHTNGYVFPFVDMKLYEETLPYLTNVSIFSYGFTTQGELIPPIIDEQPLLDKALNYNVGPLLVLTPLTKEGVFNSNLINVLVENKEMQQRLINNLLTTLREKKYAGVDVDFEFIMKDDRDAYSSFINDLTVTMNKEGFSVSVALAPKTSDEQKGLIYQGVDYGALGSAANSVLLMTYEWGYTYGPPLPVAPIQSVRKVLDYAVTKIPVDKIDMGIPNYGYDWMLPYKRGVSRADTIGNVEAIQIAIDNKARIQYDEEEQAPFFEYYKNGAKHIVWFEDVRSIKAKMELVKEYEFRGVGYWQLMNPFRANWLLVNALFSIAEWK